MDAGEAVEGAWANLNPTIARMSVLDNTTAGLNFARPAASTNRGEEEEEEVRPFQKKTHALYC